MELIDAVRRAEEVRRISKIEGRKSVESELRQISG
jgi:hypothetical protein